MTTRPTVLRRISRGALAALLVTSLAHCSSSTDPTSGDSRPELDLNIIQLPANAPPFYNTSTSFYAKVGSDASGFIYFEDQQGQRGEKFAELKIPGGALAARPDGTPFVSGDSVLITMQVAQGEILVQLEPSGLTFRSGTPAELKLDYGEVGGDFNHDGHVDGADSEIEQKLAIWRQEKAGDPFVKIGTVKVEDASELEAKLTSFSRYAIAY
jgi:hypothetical protein